MNIDIKILNDAAMLPARAKPSDAGADLFSTHDDAIAPGQRRLIKTGIAVAIPEGHYGRIAPRSGLAWKRGIDVMAGVIDAGYRDELGVVLINLSDEVFNIKRGDRIAQLIIEKCEEVKWNVVGELPESVRGEGGFGSTGS